MLRKYIQKFQQMPVTVRSSLWYTICNFLQRGMAVITVPIFTRLLTTEQYGLCSIYFAWFEIFVLFTSLKMPYEGLNNGLIRHEEDKDGYASAVLGLITVLTIGMFILYLIFGRWIDVFTGLNRVVMVLMFVQVFFNPALALWTNREKFDFRYRLPVVVTILSALLAPVISVLAVLFTDYKAEGRIAGTVAVQAIFGLICYFLIFGKGKKFYVKEYWHFALGFNLPLVFYYMSQTILNDADRIMIQHYIGTGEAGIYNVGYSAASLVRLLVSAINGSLNPWMYRKLKSGEYREISGVVNAIGLFFGAAILGLCMFAPDLIRILAARDYYAAIWIVPPVAVSIFYLFLYQVFANVEMYYGKNQGAALISILAAVANVILNAIAIPIWGYQAAGWTTLICYMLLAVLHYILMQKAFREAGGEGELFRLPVLIGISAVITAITALGLAMYQLSWGRYLILLAELVLGILFRERILAFIKKITARG